jgi:hypothetical protein
VWGLTSGRKAYFPPLGGKQGPNGTTLANLLYFPLRAYLFSPTSLFIFPYERSIGLDWIGLDWIGLDWIGLDWILFREKKTPCVNNYIPSNRFYVS